MIILLNGTSSSGKTSVARELQKNLPEPHIVYSRDQFHEMLDPQFWSDPELRRTTGPTLFTGFHMSIAGFARASVPVIVDHVVNQREWIAELEDVWSPFTVRKIGVKCPLDVVEERERTRGDREIGLARSQFEVVHRYLQYDLEIDTSKYSPAECADQILTFAMKY